MYTRAKNIYIRFAMIGLGLGDYSFSPLKSSLTRILMRLLVIDIIFLIRENITNQNYTGAEFR
jgi:hypothetical protein